LKQSIDFAFWFVAVSSFYFTVRWSLSSIE